MHEVARDFKLTSLRTFEYDKALVTRTLKNFSITIDERRVAPPGQFTVLLHCDFEPVRPAASNINTTHPWKFLERCLRSAQIHCEERSLQLVQSDRLDLLSGNVFDVADDVDSLDGKYLEIRNAPDERGQNQHNCSQ